MEGLSSKYGIGYLASHCILYCGVVWSLSCLRVMTVEGVQYFLENFLMVMLIIILCLSHTGSEPRALGSVPKPVEIVQSSHISVELLIWLLCSPHTCMPKISIPNYCMLLPYPVKPEPSSGPPIYCPNIL